MPRSSKQVEIDARWVYWRSFLLFFLVHQLMVWHRISLLPVRMPGHRMIIFLLAPWATPQSFALQASSVEMGAAAALAAAAANPASAAAAGPAYSSALL